jgi:membrane protease YdiL (CAAX protease family)
MSIGPPFQHPGSPPPRPEVPEGIIPAPLPSPAPAPRFSASDLTGWPWWTPFAALLLTGVAGAIVLGVMIVFTEAAGTPVDTDDLPTGITVGGTLIQDGLLIGFAILLAGLRGGRPTPWAFGFRPARFWRSAAWMLGAFLAFYAFSFVWAVALGIKESDDLAEQLGAKDSTLNLILVTGLVTIAAPLTEETFFRGFCFPALSNLMGWIGGAVVTGIIFGLIHAGGTKAEFLVPLGVFGFLLCVLYRMTGSILPCIALHAINNAIALGVTLKWEWWQVLLGIALAPTVVLSIALLLARRRPPAPAPAPA